MTTKILALVDALGNLVGFRLLPGQGHDICGVEPLIRDRESGALLADKAFDADWLVKDLTERGSKVVIPPRSNRKAAREYDKEIYKWRHLVENFFCKLKEFKKVAMRAEKTDTFFSANIYLAVTHRLAIMSTAPRCACSRHPGERVAPSASNRLRAVFLWPLGTRSPPLQELPTTNDRL